MLNKNYLLFIFSLMVIAGCGLGSVSPGDDELYKKSGSNLTQTRADLAKCHFYDKKTVTIPSVFPNEIDIENSFCMYDKGYRYNSSKAKPNLPISLCYMYKENRRNLAPACVARGIY